MKFIPIADRVLIEPIKQAELSAGGIIIPEIAKKKSNIGIIASAGNDCVVKSGDRVLFLENAGTEHSEGGRDFRIIKEDDVLCII